MKKTALALVMTIFTVGSLCSTFSHAQGPDNQGGKQWQQGAEHNQKQGNRDNQPNRDNRGGKEQGRKNGGSPGGSERNHFTSNGHDFRKGRAAPERYRGDDYRVKDWRDRGLREPPTGQNWAYIDGNYVLIAAATGIITSIILSNTLQR